MSVVDTMWLEQIGWGSRKSVAETIVAVFVTFSVIHVVRVYQRRQHLPPGPWPWPILGHVFVLTGLAHRNLQKLAARYGGLMYIQLGEKPCLVVSTAAAAKEMFRVHDATFSSRPRKLVLDILTNGPYRSLPIAPYGHYWRQLRRLANTQLFSPATHASHQGIRQGEVQNMMKHLVEQTRHGAGPVDLKNWFTGVTSNNMTMMLTNNRFFDIRDMNEEKRRYDDVLRRSVDANGAMIISDYVPSLSFIPRWQGWHSYILGLQRRGREIVHKVIEVEKHRQRVKDENYVPDFVDVLLKAPLDDGRKPLSDGDIMSLLLSFLNAGTDTSATTAEWAMAELITHPGIMQKAQAELVAVVGEDRLVQEVDIPKLPLLQAIVKETLRLHPAAPLAIPRESHEPCVVSGYQFPAQTLLIVNLFAIQRDPSVYENPDEFKPSRFMEHPEVNPLTGHDDFQLIPFGVGRRMCPGARLAHALVSLMLANLLHSFDWSLPEGQSAEGLDMQEAVSFIMYKDKRLCLNAKPRSPASLY
uniref:Flavonoid 3'-hydroxylase n=1 Tax=Pohlia nutans TaxID=140635 RepID=W5XJR7_9BRYO|nr:flavonoid 3'-hydroxylase [Pohlia nutans]